MCRAPRRLLSLPEGKNFRLDEPPGTQVVFSGDEFPQGFPVHLLQQPPDLASPAGVGFEGPPHVPAGR